MKFEIKSRWDSKILFEADEESLSVIVQSAVKAAINLDGANLDGANLVRANLYGANLVRANLDGANLDRANLYGANLDGANLVRANLYGANLVRANLDGANLDGANLVRANLYGANLVRANLDGANLVRAKGVKDHMSIGRIGSRNDRLTATLTTGGTVKVKCGCWTGTLSAFAKRVQEVHVDNEHGRAYLAAIELIKIRFQIEKK